MLGKDACNMQNQRLLNINQYKSYKSVRDKPLDKKYEQDMYRDPVIHRSGNLYRQWTYDNNETGLNCL